MHGKINIEELLQSLSGFAAYLYRPSLGNTQEAILSVC
jgi:hypothetical protein